MNNYDLIILDRRAVSRVLPPGALKDVQLLEGVLGKIRPLQEQGATVAVVSMEPLAGRQYAGQVWAAETSSSSWAGKYARKWRDNDPCAGSRKLLVREVAQLLGANSA